MAVTQQTPRNISTAAAGATVFPYSFKVLDKTDLLVQVNGVTRSVDVHYTVDGVGQDTGGNITFLTPLAGGERVMRRRNMAIKRDVDYQNLGDLRSQTLNGDQDAPIMMLQQLAEQVGRAVSIGEDLDGVSTLLPIPEPSKLLGWNFAGNALRNTDPSGPGDMLLRSDLSDPTGGGKLVAVSRGGNVSNYLNYYSVTAFGVIPGAPYDQSILIQNAIDSTPDGYSLVFPYGQYLAKNLRNDRGIRLRGEARGYWGVIQSPGFATCTTLVLSGDADYLIKIGDRSNTTNTSDLSKYCVDFSAEDIAFAGGQHTVSTALVNIEHAFAPYFHNCCFNYVNGSALRLQWVYEPQFDRCHVRRVDGTKGAGKGVIWIDDKYEAIAGDNNVNHFKFLGGHIEHTWGDIFYVTEKASLDYFQVSHTKFEMGRQNFDPATAGTGNELWSVFNFGRALRIDVSHNHFANYGDYTGYRFFITAGRDIDPLTNPFGYSAAYGEFCHNHFANFGKIDRFGSGNSFIARIRGISSITVRKNTNTDTYATDRRNAVLGLYANTSSAPQQLEFLENVGTVRSRAGYQGSSRFHLGFISVNDLDTTESYSFVPDSASLSAAKSVVASSSASATLVTLPDGLLTGFPTGVRIGIRARASGSGILQVFAGASVSAGLALDPSYKTVYYDISLADLASSPNVRIRTASASSGLVYIDGIYIVPLST